MRLSLLDELFGYMTQALGLIIDKRDLKSELRVWMSGRGIG